MTRLSYRIGNIETTSYDEALKISSETKEQIERVYTTIIEKLDVDPEVINARVAGMRRHGSKLKVY